MTTKTDQLECGHAPTAGASPGTGYGTLPNGSRACYACCDDWARADMAAADDVFAYLSPDCREVTTWTGGTLGRVNRATVRRNHRTYLLVMAPDGSKWHGSGPGAGMYVRLHRSKGRKGAVTTPNS